jgi:hypothetical protein
MGSALCTHSHQIFQGSYVRTERGALISSLPRFSDRIRRGREEREKRLDEGEVSKIYVALFMH